MLNLPQNPKCDIARVSHSTLVNADCFDVFPFIEDKSIDAIICDLPYGTTENKWARRGRVCVILEQRVQRHQSQSANHKQSPP